MNNEFKYRPNIIMQQQLSSCIVKFIISSRRLFCTLRLLTFFDHQISFYTSCPGNKRRPSEGPASFLCVGDPRHHRMHLLRQPQRNRTHGSRASSLLAPLRWRLWRQLIHMPRNARAYGRHRTRG